MIHLTITIFQIYTLPYVIPFHIIATIEFIICAFGVTFNLLLFNAQRQANTWSDYENILACFITISQFLEALENLFESAARVFVYHLAKTYELPGELSVNVISDACTVSGYIIFAIISYACARALDRFYHNTNTLEHGKRAGYRDGILAYVIAIILSAAQLTPRGDHTVLRIPVPTRAIAYVFLIILLTWMFRNLRWALLTSERLHEDFAMRQVQQRLDHRLRLRQVESFSQTIFPLLKFHIILSGLVWSLDFILDYCFLYLIKGWNLTLFDYLDAMSTIILDSVDLMFNALYPLIYARYNPKVRRAMLPFRKSQVRPSKSQNATTTTHSLAITRQNPLENPELRINELERQWDKKRLSTKAADHAMPKAAMSYKK